MDADVKGKGIPTPKFQVEREIYIDIIIQLVQYK